MLSTLLNEGYGAEDIAKILGRHPVAVRRLIPNDHKVTKRLRTPYGLTDETYALRAKLGLIIAEMSEKGLSREEIGELTGLNKRESYRAEQRPYSHDWTLSQMERTLAYGSKTGRSRIEILETDAEDEA